MKGRKEEGKRKCGERKDGGEGGEVEVREEEGSKRRRGGEGTGRKGVKEK